MELSPQPVSQSLTDDGLKPKLGVTELTPDLYRRFIMGILRDEPELYDAAQKNFERFVRGRSHGRCALYGEMIVGVIVYSIPLSTKASRAKLDYIWWATADRNPTLGKFLIQSMVAHSPISNWSAILPESVMSYLLAFKAAGWVAGKVVPGHFGRIDGIKFTYQEVRNVPSEITVESQPIEPDDPEPQTSPV